MKLTILTILLTCSLKVIAQPPGNGITATFISTPLEEALLTIENQSNYQFKYVKSWTDSIFVSGSFENSPVEETLNALLSGTSLNYFLTSNQVILTDRVEIRDQLPTGFFGGGRTPGTATDPEKEGSLAFLRELVLDQEVRSNDKSLIEIGNKSKLVINGSSTIAGYIREQSTGGPLVGVLVYIPDPFIGVSTDHLGFYSLTIPNGTKELRAQFVGMRDIEQNVLVYSDGRLDLSMEEEIIALKEITIESERDVNINRVVMGVNSLTVKSIKNVPLVLGEPDVLKVAQTLPGVQTVGEGAAGFNVRGGRVDQNLITVNGAPIYNPYHFFGFFSILNSTVIKKLDLYKGSIPAQYGGRLSSVFDIQMKDGNLKKLSGFANISPAMAGLTLEGPIVKDQTSFILGARTTYSDWVLGLIPESSIKDSEVFFFDVVGKVSHRINDKNQLFVSGYYSRDRFNLSTDSLFSYNNINGSVQWRHNFTNKLISEFSAVYSQYDFNIDFTAQPSESFNSGFKVGESGIKLDFGYYLNKVHKFDFGYQGTHYRINPGFKNPVGSESIVTPVNIEKEQGLESAFYISDQIEINPRLSVYLGLRYSIFTYMGPKTVYLYDPSQPRGPSSIIDTVVFTGNDFIKTYHGPEYRISAKYSLDSETSVKIGYNKTRQYIHQLTNSFSISPTDTWKLTDPNIQPQIGDQVSAGIFKNFLNNSVETSIELYYKAMDNILAFKDQALLTLNPNIETEIIQGEGKSYGVELLIKKKTGKLNGWISYTYSRAKLKVDGISEPEKINDGEFFPATYDKPHALDVVANFKLTRRYSISTNLAYSTGRPVTFPVAKYEFGGSEKIHFSRRNEFRVPDYFRLDIGLNIEGNHKRKKVAHGFWNISVYNVTGRDNVYSVFFESKDGEILPKQLSVFGAPIPTITYNLSF